MHLTQPETYTTRYQIFLFMIDWWWFSLISISYIMYVIFNVCLRFFSNSYMIWGCSCNSNTSDLCFFICALYVTKNKQIQTLSNGITKIVLLRKYFRYLYETNTIVFTNTSAIIGTKFHLSMVCSTRENLAFSFETGYSSIINKHSLCIMICILPLVRTAAEE